MKKVTKIIILAVFLPLLLTVILFTKDGTENQAEAVAAFKCLQADDVYKEVYIFSSVPKDNEVKIENILNGIMGSFNIQSNNPVISFDKDGEKQEEWHGDDGKVFVNMTKRSNKDKYSLYVDINTSDNNFELQNSITDMEKIFNRQNLKYEVTLSIKGTKLGKLNKDEVFNIKNKLMTQCKANQVTEYEENGTYSYTAFSKSMGRFIRIGGKKVNLNIAIRYSDTDNKTYIYLATPVIRTEV